MKKTKIETSGDKNKDLIKDKAKLPRLSKKQLSAANIIKNAVNIQSSFASIMMNVRTESEIDELLDDPNTSYIQKYQLNLIKNHKQYPGLINNILAMTSVKDLLLRQEEVERKEEDSNIRKLDCLFEEKEEK